MCNFLLSSNYSRVFFSPAVGLRVDALTMILQLYVCVRVGDQNCLSIYKRLIKGDLVLPATGEGPLPSAVVAKAEDGDDRGGGAHLLVMLVVVDDDDGGDDEDGDRGERGGFLVAIMIVKIIVLVMMIKLVVMS